MLDRLPTELISLVIDATSSDAWERKALIESLGLVYTSYRFVTRPLRQSTVHVPKASVIPLLRSWPAATRKAVDTVFVGSSDQAKPNEPFEIRDYSRLLSILPNVKHIFLQRVGDQYMYKKQFLPGKFFFELNSSNPFKQCLSLSLRRSTWEFSQTLDTPRFQLRRLRLELVWEGPSPIHGKRWGFGLEHFLTTQRLPCLRELRVSCWRVPTLSADFINQLHVAQVDFPYVAEIEHDYGDLRQMDSTSTQVLTSFDATSCYPTYRRPYIWKTIGHVVYAHLRTRDVAELSTTVRLLPDLEALSFEISSPSISTRDLDALDKPEVADTLSYLKTRSIELFAAGSEDDDFVDSGFVRFLDSRRTRI